MNFCISNLKRVLIKAAAAALAAGLLLTGCGGSSQSGETLTPEFFTGTLSGEITVSAYDSMSYKNYLEEAARLFEERYPGTKINVETFSAMPEMRTSDDGNVRVSLITGTNDPQSRNDYINRVNTNIMSGTGADVYAVDIIPLHKFVDRGTLENLQRYMDTDPAFNRGDYRQNILDALDYKNGTWFLPVEYNFNYYIYDSTLVPARTAAGFGAGKSWSTEQLLNLGMSMYNGENKLFSSADYTRMSGGLFRQLLNENIRSFVNMETKRANFTDGRFTGLLESIRKYAEDGLIPKGVTGQQEPGQFMQRLDIMAREPADRFFFKLSNNVSLLNLFTRNSGMMVRAYAGEGSASIDTDDEIAGIQAMSDGSVPFSYGKGFGINSQSKNKALAWAFIKFLLSDETRLSSISAMDIPVNNKARDEKLELIFSGIFGNIRMGPGGGGGRTEEIVLNAQQRQSLENYKAAVERLSDNINSFVVQDTSVNDMIASEVQYYFDGSRTAQEVARVLQNKVDLYLNE